MSKQRYNLMDVLKTLKICYKRTGDYKGRSGRKEYWTHFIFFVSIFVISIYLAINVHEGFFFLAFGFPLLNIFTSLALFIRRLHDLNLPAWILIFPAFLNFIGSMFEAPAINLIVLVCMQILCLMPGTKGKNNYGKVHKIK